MNLKNWKETQRIREWKNNGEDSGCLHVMGNGQLCVYEQGPQLVQIFGPPYSSPTASFQLLLGDDEPLRCLSSRFMGTAVWRHRLLRAERSIGEFIDFVSPRRNGWVRLARLEEPVRARLEAHSVMEVLPNSSRFGNEDMGGAVYGRIPARTPVFAQLPCPRDRHSQMVCRGAIAFQPEEAFPGWVQWEPGESFLAIAGGGAYGECMDQAEALMHGNGEEELRMALEDGAAFTERRQAFHSDFSEASSWSAEVLEVIDSVATLIRAQQGEDGGVLAGHFYHLGYIRDQYGVSRVLLTLGYFEEARRILERLFEVFHSLGRLYNAHGIDEANLHHLHENDDVEITGYLLLQAFDYLDATGDHLFIRRLFPMLEWAWEAQTRHLVQHMLPFNGDETYVAGGVLPRSTLLDGSAEATLLFIAGGKRLWKWAGANRMVPADSLRKNLELIRETAKAFRGNFQRGDGLRTNAPERREAAEVPRFRHGVCESCLAFGWSEINPNGRYVCPRCLKAPHLPAEPARDWELQSVGLLPFYLPNPLFRPEDFRPLVEKLARTFKEKGELASRPGGNITVGYDYGLLLYALSVLHHPDRTFLREAMLARVDRTGAWVEYYEKGKPKGCRCRPWESGINLDGLILSLRS